MRAFALIFAAFLISSCSSEDPGPMIVDPCDEVTYSETIKPLMDTSCRLPTCHIPGTEAPPFSDFATIQALSASIKVRTGNRSMPLQGSLTQTQIDQIACWVDSGALNN